MDRASFIKEIELRRGLVKNSVSKNTDLVIIGEDPGSNKVEGAHKYGIPTIFFPVAIALGLFEIRNGGTLRHIERTFLSTLTTSMATAAEEVLVLAEQNPRLYEGYNDLAASLECVLTAAYGPSEGTIGSGPVDDI